MMLKSMVNRLFYPSLQHGIQKYQIKTFSVNIPRMVTKQLDSIEKSFNQAILIGRVGHNPESRGTEVNPVVTFSLATNNMYSKNEEFIQEAEWHRIAVFKPSLRERVLKYMMKGARVMVTGRITYFERKDPNDPKIIVKNASIVAEDIIFLNK